MKPADAIRAVFKEAGVDLDTVSIVATCGHGELCNVLVLHSVSKSYFQHVHRCGVSRSSCLLYIFGGNNGGCRWLKLVVHKR